MMVDMFNILDYENSSCISFDNVEDISSQEINIGFSEVDSLED